MSANPVAGGVYSVKRGDDQRFGIVKILDVRESAIFAKVFQRCANVRPELAWFDHPDDRAPGKLDEVLELGIGLLPVTPRVFQYWEPLFLFAQDLTDEEQDLLGEYGDVAQPWDDLRYA
jgi:hypothetical protein